MERFHIQNNYQVMKKICPLLATPRKLLEAYMQFLQAILNQQTRLKRTACQHGKCTRISTVYHTGDGFSVTLEEKGKYHYQNIPQASV
jgi:hypothetical protein